MKDGEKLIIGLIGEMACGKGFAVNYLVEKYKASSYKFSTVLREILSALDLEISRENLSGLSLILRQRFGENVFGKAIAKRAKNDNNRIVVVDGIRRMEDLISLGEIQNFILVRIVSDPKIRYERFIKRGENVGDNKKTFEQFVWDHKALETELYIPEIMKAAKEELVNDGEAEILYKQLDNLIKKYD